MYTGGIFGSIRVATQAAESHLPFSQAVRVDDYGGSDGGHGGSGCRDSGREAA